MCDERLQATANSGEKSTIECEPGSTPTTEPESPAAVPARPLLRFLRLVARLASPEAISPADNTPTDAEGGVR